VMLHHLVIGSQCLLLTWCSYAQGQNIW
jgi:hypothetical protein